ncbi:sigma factor-like helix-turn-helix DNA-binding protein [Streptococcus suis]|uniref:sigma factor-like helix-turn-helix DNA-binding protein n=1 Tax=Streptococcus suis TaxID=1307 RepID=UPI0009425140|nr:sigma factor-like helix-turn-helix DNA-binding protein [Streptococcus suis]MCB2927371.1 sigma-70 family RNA polymerase sigma factor [Streptococcus suis]HEL2364498.1 sigma-70 family RNA polymerase sigma factor [Streptococcus suis]HEL2468082.1 sigma-70 family RNA polymerase sigma factor [Streptococcus suis]HEL2668423.1 sigma-70 family RNA polymerase sigma factor [Streptococcus suis]HEL2731401.1 sigma-70 family RNA polymerase sigma factor [Streptococcus suis]
MVYFIHVNNIKVPVSDEVYREYWRLTNRENYLKRLEIQYKVRPFSDFSDSQLINFIADDKMDLEKIIETREILQLLYEALLTLNDEEFTLVKDLFFEEKTLNEISQSNQISISTVARRRDKILNYLKKLLK